MGRDILDGLDVVHPMTVAAGRCHLEPHFVETEAVDTVAEVGHGSFVLEPELGLIALVTLGAGLKEIEF
jgi:hypothetical protein